MIDAEKNTLLHMRKNIILTAFAINRKGGICEEKNTEVDRGSNLSFYQGIL